MKNGLEFVTIYEARQTKYGIALSYRCNTVMYFEEIRARVSNAELLDHLPRGHHDFSLLLYEDGSMKINSVCGCYLSSYQAQPDNTWKRVI